MLLQQLPHIAQGWDNLTYKLLDFPLIHNVLSRHLQCETEKFEKLFRNNCAEGHTFKAVLACLLAGAHARLPLVLALAAVLASSVLAARYARVEPALGGRELASDHCLDLRAEPRQLLQLAQLVAAGFPRSPAPSTSSSATRTTTS